MYKLIRSNVLRLARIPLFLVVILGSCKTNDGIRSAIVGNVLRDFVYVGDQAVPQTDELLDSLVPHGVDPKAPPEVFQEGYSYVFHHPEPTDNEGLALRVIPERLQNSGFVISQRPLGIRDLVYPYLGGPDFIFEFHSGDRRFMLRAYSCDSTSRRTEFEDGWSESDFILVALTGGEIGNTHEIR